jgi:hypothetical protein
MQRAILLIIILACAACTTLQPLAGDPVQQLKVGDRIVLVTQDNLKHRFRVDSIDAAVVTGPSQAVPIDQIVSVQRRQFSRGKTVALVAALAGGAALVIGLAVAAASIPAATL